MSNFNNQIFSWWTTSFKAMSRCHGLSTYNRVVCGDGCFNLCTLITQCATGVLTLTLTLCTHPQGPIRLSQVRLPKPAVLTHTHSHKSLETDGWAFTDGWLSVNNIWGPLIYIQCPLIYIQCPLIYTWSQESADSYGYLMIYFSKRKIILKAS